MFDKLKDYFNGKQSKEDAAGGTNEDESQEELAEQSLEREESSEANLPRSEFSIRYSRNKASMPRLVPVGTDLNAKPEANKFDAMVYIIHCTKHHTLAVYEDATGLVKWFPFTPLFPEKSWTESCVAGTVLILCNDKEQYKSLKQTPPIESMQLLEILRIQQPQTLNFLTRMIFYVRLKQDAAHFRCCQPQASISWVGLKSLASGEVTNIWGPELVQYARIVAGGFAHFNERLDEFSLDEVYLYSPRDPPRNAEETMLLELDISEKIIEVLYNDYMQHCFPCFSMPLESFRYYFSKYGLSGSDTRLDALFMAFNYKKTGYVAFHELLMGLASLEPLAPHQETRIKFIFRFYDAGNKSHLDMHDFARMVADIFPGSSEEDLRAKTDECLRAVGTTVKDKVGPCVTFANFMTAIRTHKFRGTSKLCRSSVAVFLQLTRAFSFKKRYDSDGLREWRNLDAVLLSRKHKDICGQCKSRRFKLATHSVDVSAKGYASTSVRITNRDNKSAPIDVRSVELVFNKQSVPNTLIKLVRDFNRRKGNCKEPRGLLDKGAKEHKEMHALMLKLSKELKPILRAESRCPNVTSPAIVIGDIHGNLEDLLTLEKTLWRRVPLFGPSFVFLGDYVDRGKWGLECAVYLMALKVLDPGKVTLLRGNHEVRPLQEKYTFKRECVAKYGADVGDKIWQLSNQLFDMMPVAATIDRAVFCTHGGLSPHAKTLDQIRAMPVVLDNPELQSKVAWDLLWSDPCHMQQYLDTLEMTDLNEFAQAGFVVNQKRGAAYLFNERAANTFLAHNGLSHMIRAHEVPPFGFQHHFTNVCTTVFSCSHYCNNENEAACILLYKNRIRAIRIDTHNNAPATDK